MHDDLDTRIADFLAAGSFAVVGASRNRDKYGNKVLRAYLQRGLPATPIHPACTDIEGLTAFPHLGAMPAAPGAVSIITSPTVSLRVVEQAANLGIRHLWLQPGAEDHAVLARAAELGLRPIAGGPCILVVLRFREDVGAPNH